jgi:hypothetical protein
VKLLMRSKWTVVRRLPLFVKDFLAGHTK